MSLLPKDSCRVNAFPINFPMNFLAHTHKILKLVWNHKEEEMASLFSILIWRIPFDRGAWWATVHRVAKRGQD